MNDQTLDAILALIKAHQEEDTRRFASIEGKLDGIDTKCDSLLLSREHQKGARWATGLIATIVSGVVTGLISLVALFFKAH